MAAAPWIHCHTCAAADPPARLENPGSRRGPIYLLNMARGRGLRGRFGGRREVSAVAAPPVAEWIDPATVQLHVDWQASAPLTQDLAVEIARIRQLALPNSWLPFNQKLKIVDEGVAADVPFDPEGLALEIDALRGRITVGSWLNLGRHCAELAPMPCTIDEWEAALAADRELFSKVGFRRQVKLAMSIRDLGMDMEALKSDPDIGARLNAIVNDGVDPREMSVERDYLGDCMVATAEAAGYPVLEIRDDQMRSVTDHGGCRISRLSANDKQMMQLIFLMLDRPAPTEGGVLWLEDSNPNRSALLKRVWPARPTVRTTRPF